jgi:hypothetical protein
LGTRPRTSRTQHTGGLWRPRSAERGDCARDYAPAGPDTPSFPAPWPCEVRRARLLSRRCQLGSAHGRGGSSGVLLLLGGAAAGVGGTWEGASAPSPFSLRQPRADRVASPDPPPRRAPRDHGGRCRRARPASHQSVRMPGLRPRTPAADSWSPDTGVSAQGLAPWAPVRRRRTGRPVAQCLTKRWTSKTSLVRSRW